MAESESMACVCVCVCRCVCVRILDADGERAHSVERERAWMVHDGWWCDGWERSCAAPCHDDDLASMSVSMREVVGVSAHPHHGAN